jgi:hypothetical protein
VFIFRRRRLWTSPHQAPQLAAVLFESAPIAWRSRYDQQALAAKTVVESDLEMRALFDPAGQTVLPQQGEGQA